MTDECGADQQIGFGTETVCASIANRRRDTNSVFEMRYVLFVQSLAVLVVPAGLSADETRAYEELHDFFTKHIGYATEMGTRPQTLYGVVDSPVGLAA